MESKQEPTTLPSSTPSSTTITTTTTTTTSIAPNSTTPTLTPNSETLTPVPLSFDSAITSFSLTRPDAYPKTIYNPSNGSLKPCGFEMVSDEPVKRKRGRPRKYPGPEGGVMSGLSPGSKAASGMPQSHSKSGPNESSYKPRSKAAGKKQQLNALRSVERDFTAHVIVVKSGEDIGSKIMGFSRQGPNTVCILSANGVVCNVTLRQPATYGGTVSYEGRFEIISLSGSFLLMESGGNRTRSGGMSVTLAGTDGRVLGGGVAGMLIAATPVQVIVASFSAEDHLKPEQPIREPLASASPYMMGFGMPVAAANPSFRSNQSESSEETGSPTDWNSKSCNDTDQSNNPGSFTYSSISHGNIYSSNPHKEEPSTELTPN